MVRIHPFDDGNGRGARILMNLILIKKAYPPAIMEEQRQYFATLSQADKGDRSGSHFWYLWQSLLSKHSRASLRI